METKHLPVSISYAVRVKNFLFVLTLVSLCSAGVYIYLFSSVTFFDRPVIATLLQGIANTFSIGRIDDFQKIGNSSEKSFVYSAYFEENGLTEENGATVVVVAVLKAISPPDLFCQFFNEFQYKIGSVEASLIPLDYDNKYWQFPYQPYFINCNASNYKPAYISMIETNDTEEIATNLLRVHYKYGRKYNISLCIKPFYNFEHPFEFAEFMEYYIMMGVEKFTFYNISIGPKTSCLMKSYGNLVEVLPFSSPYVFHKEIVVSGDVIASNECLQRYRQVSKYLIIVDADEMIIPSSLSLGNNLNEMMDVLNSNFKTNNYSIEKISGYRFVNGFFFAEWKADEEIIKSLKVDGNPKAESVLRHMQMSTKVMRDRDFISWRGKYIAVPDLAIELSIHEIIKSIGEAHPVLVSSDHAYMHHYRTCKHSISFSENCTSKERIYDETAKRFAEKLAIRVSERIFSVAKECDVNFS